MKQDQKTNAISNRELLDETLGIERSSKLDNLIRIKELLTRIEDVELVNNQISENLILDCQNLNITLNNMDLLNSVDEVESKIYKTISKYFISKAIIFDKELTKIKTNKKK